MIAGELINKIHNSHRMIVEDHTGEIYRGYTGLLKKDPAFLQIRDAAVSEVGLGVKLYKKEYLGRYGHEVKLDEVDRAGAGQISYRDMDEHIYFMIRIGV